MHIASDGLIALSYYSIPVTIALLALRRRDLAFSWVFWLFAVFILACGTTHVLDIWTLWHPDYWAQGVVKMVTAASSVLTAVLLWPMLPRALALTAPAELRRANARLSDEIAQKERALEALQRETVERRRTEAMLIQAHKMEALGALTGGMAHDFNNLLMIVQGSLEALEARLAGDQGALRHVQRALRGAHQGSALTQQLLAYARKQPLQPIALDVNARITALRDLMPKLDIAFRLDADLWLAEADPQQVDSAILNLMINARDAMPDGGHVTITTANRIIEPDAPDMPRDAESGAFVSIAVADTGIGMTEEVRAMAFEPFFTTKPPGSGSGLGLSQVYGFAKQSQGFATLHSAPGAGTTVTIYLRRSGGADAGDASIKAAESVGRTNP
jgi:signal transduction histidine kinase